MARHYPLFAGANYKERMEDGLNRRFLNGTELALLFPDGCLPANGTDVMSEMMVMDKWLDAARLEKGDFLYLQVIPDVMMVSGFWLMPQFGMEGFEGKISLVDANEVHDLHCEEGDISKATQYGAELEVSLEVGLCEATKDACYKANYHEGAYSDFRHVDAFQATLFETPFIAALEKPMYLRLEITDYTAPESDTCSTCSSTTGLPNIQFGTILTDLHVKKQLISNFCNCRTVICAGAKPDCDNCEDC